MISGYCCSACALATTVVRGTSTSLAVGTSVSASRSCFVLSLLHLTYGQQLFSCEPSSIYAYHWIKHFCTFGDYTHVHLLSVRCCRQGCIPLPLPRCDGLLLVDCTVYTNCYRHYMIQVNLPHPVQHPDPGHCCCLYCIPRDVL